MSDEGGPIPASPASPASSELDDLAELVAGDDQRLRALVRRAVARAYSAGFQDGADFAAATLIPPLSWETEGDTIWQRRARRSQTGAGGSA